MHATPTTMASTPACSPSRADGWAGVVAVCLGAYALVGGSLTLVGWVFDIRRLTDWRDDGISMQVNTAMAAVLSGVALLLLVECAPRWRRVAVRIVGGLVATIGGVTLLQHVSGLSLGLDTALIDRDWGQTATTSRMRMGPPASISFLTLGAAMVLATISPRARQLASLLAIVPIAIASLSLTGYWFGVDQLFGMARYTAIAWQTSTILTALGIGMIAAAPEYGVVASLRPADAGGQVLRWLLLPIIAMPFVLGWLRVRGADAAWFDAAFGTALLTLVEVALFLGLLLWTASHIRRYAFAAHEAHARLAAIVESTEDAVLSKSLEGVVRTWNAGAERLFGYSESEVVGRSIFLIVPGERAQEEESILSRVRAGEPVENYETVRVCKDGAPRDVSLTISPVRDAQGRIIGASTIARDVTERKRAEEAIRRREGELQTLADTIPQLAWMAHPDGNVFWYNRGWYEYTGKSLDKLAGWGWQSLVHQKDLPQVLGRWKHSLESGDPFEMEYRLRAADGAPRWFLTRVRPLCDEGGAVVRWFGTNTDIDDAKHVEAKLREQAHTLELLNDTATIVGSTLELQQLLQSITDVATELSGAQFGAFFYNSTTEQGDAYMLYTLSGASPQDFERFGMPRSTPLFGPTFRGEGVVRSGDIQQDPRYGRMAPHHGMPKGHLPVRSYLAAPVTSRTGEVTGGLFFGHSDRDVFSEQIEKIISGVASQAAVAIDNSRMYEDLKQAADERLRLLDAERAARSEAERINMMKDEFLATLSHELRTPLSAILGWSQILRLGKSDATEVAEGLESIERNARAQTQLIEDLLDMSRIISGKVRLDVRSTALTDVLDQAVESVRLAAEAKKIRLRKVYNPYTGEVSGDAARLQQVFWNLLSNAIKFTPEDGAVDVVLERVNSHAEVTVRDTGIGIPADFLAQVFDRFRQADASSTRSHGGLGLGLSIVKNLVELHGGSVRASSEGEDRGAAFTVTLPLAPARLGAGRKKDAVADAGLPFDSVRLAGVRVLVVDDEPDARALVKRVLTRCDAEVITAQNADEGLEWMRTNTPDLIVSDIGMPGKDGYQFIREVRDMPPYRGGRVPAVALTAFARAEDRTRAMLAGYQVYVAKPIEPQKLVATVRSLLDQKE